MPNLGYLIPSDYSVLSISLLIEFICFKISGAACGIGYYGLYWPIISGELPFESVLVADP